MPVIIKTGGGGGGAGSAVDTDTYANIPAAGDDGALFFPSDGTKIFRDNGVSWAPFGDMFSLTDPPTAGWSWVNQDTAVLDTTHGGISIRGTTGGAAQSLNCYVRAAPSTPYTVTGMLLADYDYYANPGYGLVWRSSGDGKLTVMYLWGYTPSIMQINKYNSPTSANANYGEATWWVPEDSGIYPRYLRLEDNGVTRYASISNDGFHFPYIFGIGRTDFHTPDQVGFFVNAFSKDVTARLIHWKEE